MPDEQLNLHNLALAEQVNRGGAAYLTTALVGGRQILRLSIGSETTEREDVQAVWSLLNRQARGLL
jgi:aromatic-L-amino-acid decarboxylase